MDKDRVCLERRAAHGDPSVPTAPEHARSRYSPRRLTAASFPGLPPSAGPGDPGILLGLGAAHRVIGHFASIRTRQLFPADLPWRQAEARLAQAFPDREDLILVVLDGATRISRSAARRRWRRPCGEARPVPLGAPPRRQPLFRAPRAALPAHGGAPEDHRAHDRGPAPARAAAAEPGARPPGRTRPDAAGRRARRGHARQPRRAARRAGGECGGRWRGRPARSTGPACCSTASLRRGSCGASCWSARGSTSPPCRQAPPPGRWSGRRRRAWGCGRKPVWGPPYRLRALADEEFATIREGRRPEHRPHLGAGGRAALGGAALAPSHPAGAGHGHGRVGPHRRLRTAFYGSFNVISVAFAVLVIGLGDDQSVQFAIRYREERHGLGALVPALLAAGPMAGPSMGPRGPGHHHGFWHWPRPNTSAWRNLASSPGSACCSPGC